MWSSSSRIGVSFSPRAVEVTEKRKTKVQSWYFDISMLKDYFPPDKVGRAIGLYTAGVSSGLGIASIIGGMIYPTLRAAGPVDWPLVGVLEPWQQMFVWVGAPGILIGLLLLTVREPARREFVETGRQT